MHSVFRSFGRIVKLEVEAASLMALATIPIPTLGFTDSLILELTGLQNPGTHIIGR
jgi:hypothetical protein